MRNPSPSPGLSRNSLKTSIIAVALLYLLLALVSCTPTKAGRNNSDQPSAGANTHRSVNVAGRSNRYQYDPFYSNSHD